MFKVRMHLRRSSDPTPLLIQVYSDLLNQDRVQTASKYLQGQRLHKFPRQPMSVLGRHHRAKVFLYVQKLLLCFGLCLLSCEGMW